MMRGFKFRFQQIEDLRKRLERDALMDLATEQRKLAELQQHCAWIRSEQETAKLKRNVEADETVVLMTVQLLNEYIKGLIIKENRQLNLIATQQKRVNAAMKNVIIARRKLEQILKLKEQDERNFKLERSRLEQKRLDDLVIMRHRLSGDSEL